MHGETVKDESYFIFMSGRNIYRMKIYFKLSALFQEASIISNSL